MQLFPILLVAIILAADNGFENAASWSGLSGWTVLMIAWGPIAVLLGAMALRIRRLRRRLDREGEIGAILSADRMVRVARWGLLVHHAFLVFGLGWLATVRGTVGNGVLIDELLTILPALVGVIGTWWVYYPIERRIREAVLIRQLDMGRTVFPTPSRFAWVVAQLRMHVLFLLVPILMILTLSEAVELSLATFADRSWHGWVSDLATFVAAVTVITLAPLMTHVLLDVEPLPDGPLRDDLEAVCAAHRVRIRQLMVWKTHGSMVNAAVMGLVWPLRYVLLTDALIESMTRPQLRAVMAHEIGHLRRHHLPWMMAALVTLLIAPVLLLESALAVVASWSGQVALEIPAWAGLATTIGTLLAALLAFGWISRRFERQADTFAAQHLSDRQPLIENEPSSFVTTEASTMVASALSTIARLDAVALRRPSWRHGSIAWRQAYLRTLVGQPVRGLAIDRQIRWIKIITALMLLLVLVYTTISMS